MSGCGIDESNHCFLRFFHLYLPAIYIPHKAKHLITVILLFVDLSVGPQ